MNATPFRYERASFSVHKFCLYCFYGAIALFWAHPAIPLALLAACAATHLATPSLRKQDLLALVLVGLTLAAVLPSVFLDPVSAWIFHVTIPVLALLAGTALRPNMQELGLGIGILAASCYVAAGLMYFQSGPYQLDISMTQFLTRNRVDGYYVLGTFFEGATTIGTPLGIAIIGLLYIISISTSWKVVLCAVLTIVMVLLLVLSGSRGSLAAVGFSTAVWFMSFVFSGGFTLKRWLTYAAMLAILSYAAYFGYKLMLDYMPHDVRRYEVFFDGGEDVAVSERFDVWSHYLRIAMHDWMGNGYGYYRRISNSGTYTAHNELLGNFVAGGIFGAMAFLLITFFALKRSFAMMPSKTASAALALSVYFIIIGFTEHYSVSNERLALMIFWLLASMICACQETPSSRIVGQSMRRRRKLSPQPV